MPIEPAEPTAELLPEVIRVLGEWQADDVPIQLHPGDVGWFGRFGGPATAAALRLWRRDSALVAIGLLDGPEVVRLAIAPDRQRDDELAGAIARFATEQRVAVEAPEGAAVREHLIDAGWPAGESWTPLRRDLAEPVADSGLRIEVVDAHRAAVRVAVQRAAFDKSTFTEGRWRDMATGPAYADARCLVGYDDRGNAVAAATAWSAGIGKPGLLEPVGVHRDHRGLGYGRAIAVAAAAALRDLGSSSATVVTPTANVTAVATYRSAGLHALPDVPDLTVPDFAPRTVGISPE
jgi:ribosomal protein S18 acetylase RimI-like enzyme